jgi:hypothetical protein
VVHGRRERPASDPLARVTVATDYRDELAIISRELDAAIAADATFGILIQQQLIPLTNSIAH